MISRKEQIAHPRRRLRSGRPREGPFRFRQAAGCSFCRNLGGTPEPIANVARTMKGLAFSLILASAASALALATPSLDGARIVNSGSTNTVAWTIALHSDGSGTVTHQARPFGSLDPVAHTFSVDRDLAQHFFSSAKLARTSNGPAARCMKSASFGVIVNVQYHNWRSPDLTCPPLSGALGELAADVSKIQAAAGVGAEQPRRIPNPNYMKRAPLEGPASPTPKATP